MKKGFSVAVAVDERLGTFFGGKRQSRDKVLIEDFIATANGRRIVIRPYSISQFKCYDGDLKVCDLPLNDALDGEICFIEGQDLFPFAEMISELIIYNFNRHYPSDKRLDVVPQEIGLRLFEKVELAGFSHEKITKEIYRKCEK